MAFMLPLVTILGLLLAWMVFSIIGEAMKTHEVPTPKPYVPSKYYPKDPITSLWQVRTPVQWVFEIITFIVVMPIALGVYLIGPILALVEYLR